MINNHVSQPSRYAHENNASCRGTGSQLTMADPQLDSTGGGTHSRRGYSMVKSVYRLKPKREYLLSDMEFRILVVLVVFAASAYSYTQDEWDRLWEQAEQKCEEMLKFKQSDKKGLLSIDEVPKRAKCFVSCFFDEVGLTNGTEINHELYSKWLDEELRRARNKDAIIASVKSCINGINRTEKCTTAFQLYECFGKKYFA